MSSNFPWLSVQWHLVCQLVHCLEPVGRPDVARAAQALGLQVRPTHTDDQLAEGAGVEAPPAPAPLAAPAARRGTACARLLEEAYRRAHCTWRCTRRDTLPEPLEDMFRLYDPVVEKGKWTAGLCQMW